MPEKYNTTERSSITEQSIHMLLVNCVIFFDIEKNTQFMKMYVCSCHVTYAFQSESTHSIVA